MDRKSETNGKTSSQHDRFIETARKLGADEDEAAFKAKLAVIARQKPKGPPAILEAADRAEPLRQADAGTSPAHDKGRVDR